MVFVAFTQQCIQSIVTHLTHIERVKTVLYSVYRGLTLLPRGKAIFFLKSLPSCGFCRAIKTKSWHNITCGCLFQERFNGHIQASGY